GPLAADGGRARDGAGGEAGEVRVIEVVPPLIAYPEPVAAHRVPADLQQDAVGHGDERRPERRENVVAVVPARVGARRAERVRVRGRPVDGEDVAAGRT